MDVSSASVTSCRCYEFALAGDHELVLQPWNFPYKSQRYGENKTRRTVANVTATILVDTSDFRSPPPHIFTVRVSKFRPGVLISADRESRIVEIPVFQFDYELREKYTRGTSSPFYFSHDFPLPLTIYTRPREYSCRLGRWEA